jgi:hypothetical protein
MVDGSTVSNGTVVKAIVDGYAYTTTTPSQTYGVASYMIEIPKPQGGSFVGKKVTFMIGNLTAAETSTYEFGGNIKLNLSATSTS